MKNNNDTKLHDEIASLRSASNKLEAAIIAGTRSTSDKVVASIPGQEVIKGVKKAEDYWHTLGPGLTTGASDDDPSGIATYSQAGAHYGFQLLWLAAFTFPLMAVVQEMCARIGMVTGRGLAGTIKQVYSKKVLIPATLLLFAANAFNIGADLGAMAKGAQLLNSDLNFYVLVVAFAGVSLALQIFTPYARYARYLKWLALVLLAYVASAILAHLSWSDILKSSVVPKILWDKDQLLLICAVLGTTISPYLFFWQTSQETEQEIASGKITLASRMGTNKKDVHEMRVDVWSGMFLSNIVMFFIIAACGGVLFKNGITDITSAAQAAEALRPFAGNATFFLFAIGIIGTGLLAVPVLAGSSSYALAESFNWKEGLSLKFRQAHAFYGIIVLSMLVGLGINFIGLDPFKALIYSAVFNGLVAPVILVPIVLISSNRKIMGEWTNRPWVTAVGAFTVLLMTIAGVATIFSLFVA